MSSTPFQKVLTKLKATEWYPMFVRHLDGDIHNNAPTNLSLVHIREAFRNLDWHVDWVSYLDEEERALITHMFAPRTTVPENPEIWEYMRFRAEREETGFDLKTSLFRGLLARGCTLFFGATTDQNGNVLSDNKNPEVFEEFRNARE